LEMASAPPRVKVQVAGERERRAFERAR